MNRNKNGMKKIMFYGIIIIMNINIGFFTAYSQESKSERVLLDILPDLFFDMHPIIQFSTEFDVYPDSLTDTTYIKNHPDFIDDIRNFYEKVRNKKTEYRLDSTRCCDSNFVYVFTVRDTLYPFASELYELYRNYLYENNTCNDSVLIDTTNEEKIHINTDSIFLPPCFLVIDKSLKEHELSAYGNFYMGYVIFEKIYFHEKKAMTRYIYLSNYPGPGHLLVDGRLYLEKIHGKWRIKDHEK